MIPFLLIAGGAYLLYDSVSDKRASFDPNRKDKANNKNLARGGKVSRFEIIKDETGYVEQGFYGVFDKQGPELLDIFEFRKEAEGYVKELNEKGISGADASKYNGQIQNYVLAEGGKIKQK